MEGVALGMKALVGGAVGKSIMYMYFFFTSTECLLISQLYPLTCFLHSLWFRGFSRSSISHHGCDG